MPYYLCETHHLAFEDRRAHQAHHNFAHKLRNDGIEIDTNAVDELPEGYTARAKKAAKQAKPVREATPAPDKPAKQTPAVIPPPQVSTVLDIDELPHEPVELFRTLLTLKGVTKTVADRLVVDFRLNRYMWADREEVKKLLLGAKLPNTNTEWIDAFLKSYGANVRIPGEDSQTTWANFLKRDEGGGGMGLGMGSSPSAPRTMFEYMMYVREQERQDRREYEERQDRERAARGGVGNPLDPSNPLAELIKKQQEQLDTLTRRLEEEQRQRTIESRFEKLDAVILELAKGGGKKDDQSDWLKAWMEEREKRGEEQEKRHQQDRANLLEKLDKTQQDSLDRLTGLQQSILEEQRKLEEAKSTGRRESEEAEKRAQDRLKESGYTTREKKTEERILDVVETGIKTIGQEVHETGQTIRQGFMQANLPAKLKKPPITSEEAADIVEKMRLQQEIGE